MYVCSIAQSGSIPLRETGRYSESSFAPSSRRTSWTLSWMRPWYEIADPLASTMSSRLNRLPISSARSQTLASMIPVRSRS